MKGKSVAGVEGEATAGGKGVTGNFIPRKRIPRVVSQSLPANAKLPKADGEPLNFVSTAVLEYLMKNNYHKAVEVFQNEMILNDKLSNPKTMNSKVSMVLLEVSFSSSCW
jgi:hypothetical protein